MKRTFIHDFGKFIMWMPQVFRKPENWTMYYKEIVRQMYDIGIGSLMIVCIISVFIGAVTAVQFSYQLGNSFIPSYYIGYIVRDMALVEFAATFTCLVLAGKVGSNMAAEIGGMRQKEHIDAMEIMGVNTSSYLVMPKILAAIVVIPLLVSVALLVSIAGGYIVSMIGNLLSHEDYTRGLRSFFIPFNVVIMYIKALTFALILATVSCFQGYFVTGGSIELGHASTRAVVFSSVLILIADFLIAVLLTS